MKKRTAFVLASLMALSFAVSQNFAFAENVTAQKSTIKQENQQTMNELRVGKAASLTPASPMTKMHKKNSKNKCNCSHKKHEAIRAIWHDSTLTKEQKIAKTKELRQNIRQKRQENKENFKKTQEEKK